MAGIASVSRKLLAGRRKKLRQKRQTKIFQAIWRTLAVTGLASSLLWVTLQPIWVLRNPKNIVISGNQLLSDQAIESLLKLSYPQSLWRIQPSRIASALQQQPTIAKAIVTRRLFPPGLIVQVHERIPVAVAQMHREQTNSGNGNKKVSVGLLDANGVLMPLEQFNSLNSTVKVPTLKVIGSPEQYRPYWTQLYQATSQSTVKVIEIDWRDPTNLILKTEIGKVHFGVPTSRLPEQIKLLAQMRHLPLQLSPNQIDYIDLKNPDNPIVQMNQVPRKINSKSP
jgi:cell division protein FtsQ